jgi:hypothetical protein
MKERWDDCTIIPQFDGPIIILIDWENTAGQWVDGSTLGHFKLFFTESQRN